MPGKKTKKAVSKAQAHLFGAMTSRGEMSKAELSRKTKGLKVSKLPNKVKGGKPVKGKKAPPFGKKKA